MISVTNSEAGSFPCVLNYMITKTCTSINYSLSKRETNVQSNGSLLPKKKNRQKKAEKNAK